MNCLIRHAMALAILLASGSLAAVRAQYLDQIGVTILRATTTNLNGAGIRVAQPEASSGPVLDFEVNPNAVGQPTNLFTYYSSAGSAVGFPNAAGRESGHANGVGGLFYGFAGGVATNVAHVDNYDADYYFAHYISPLAPAPEAMVVNQSFTFGNVSTNLPTPTNYVSVSKQQELDSAYDDYAATFVTLFISPANNGGSVSPPGTAYNCICVGAFGGSSSIGPTLDNGRCKPDITAPAGATSYSTPQVAGAAALLMQAALRGDGGSDTNAAFDIKTIKALLLNGAVKPANWTNSAASPLDKRHGAGVVNVFNAYEQLIGGQHGWIETNLVSVGGDHPPTGAAGTISTLNGWDNNTVVSRSGNARDGLNHYYFNVTNRAGGYVGTATLVWNRQPGETVINNLDLFLYDCANNNLVACSTSLVDNVEHVFVPQLAPGRYDLQVWKAGGSGMVSSAETYALAWSFVEPALNLVRVGTNAVLTWPAYPDGFRVEATTNLAAPAWSTNQLPAAGFTNGMNILPLRTTNALQFFRLRAPNF